MGDEIMGYDDYGDEGVEGEDFAVVGAARPRRMVRMPRKPSWRKRMAAPGVPMPDQGLEPLPLTPSVNAGVFETGGATIIYYEAKPQRPFRGERLLASTVLQGGAVGSAVADGIFVGTSLQTVELGSFDLSFFAANAFGVRLSLVPAAPGVLIRIPVRFEGTLGAEGTASVRLLLLGRTIQA
jgi:hypothetical protein